MRVLSILGLCVLPALAHGAPWIVITEVHYNPPGGDAEEFVEVLSREPPRADLSGWRIEGDIDYRFPDGTVIHPREHLVVARDPDALRRRHPAAARILGPYGRALGNGGGRITLRNAAGGKAAEVRFGTKGRWPATPDGAGHTLSLLDPLLDPAVPGNWSASARIGGTPGAENFPRFEAPASPIVPKGSPWRFLPGEAVRGTGWRGLEYDESRWRSGPGGLGYGDGDDATEVADMAGNYISLFARHSFQVADPAAHKRLVLRIDYDDGFIAYLNGKEVARANLGAEGSDVPADQAADGRHEAGAPTEIDLGPAASLLARGGNVLAVQVHNDNLTSSDLSLIAELFSREAPAPSGRRASPVINEVRPGPDGFVEIYNAGDADADISGWFLTDDPRDLPKLKLPGPALLKPRGLLALTRKDLGERLALRGLDLFLALTEPGGQRVADAMRLGRRDEGKQAAGAEPGPPAGRFPDGSWEVCVLDEPTPGAPNKLKLEEDLVVNEILYRSADG
ncbi:MAG: lamin tail domain-containing protein, partial [Planctomycetes bacterium]|nr:lamin tail domain-containing protein [Planctomycetota bacterium]